MLALALVTIFAHSAYASNLEVRIPAGASDGSIIKTFYPEILPIAPTDSITWTNDDSVTHSIASGVPEHPDYSGVYFKTDEIAPGKSTVVKIEKVEYFAYYYFCTIHPWLEGKIVITTAPESQPETTDAIVIDKTYDIGQDVLVTGNVAKDFARIPYDVLVYEYPDKLIDVLHGRFDKDASYMQTIDTDGLESGTYMLRTVYGLPTQVATIEFEISKDTVPEIPQWVRDTAKQWSSGGIAEEQFIDAVEYMAEEKIITIHKTSLSQTHEVPEWIKVSALWWSDGKITDKEFAKSIQYLVNSGTIQI